MSQRVNRAVFKLTTLLAITVFTQGCVSYKSVVATAQLGKAFGGQAKAVDGISDKCDWINKKTARTFDCEKEKKRKELFNRLGEHVVHRSTPAIDQGQDHPGGV
jgi:hypothetical protein